MRGMKKVVSCFLTSAGCGLLFASAVWAHAGHKHDDHEPTISLPPVVAKVNGADIASEYILRGLRQALMKTHAEGKDVSPEQEKNEAKKLIEDEIGRELLLQKGREMGLQIDGAAVEERVKKAKAGFKSEGDFLRRLEARKVTLEQYKEEIKNDLLLEAVSKKEIEPQVQAAPEEMKAYYENNKKLFWSEEKARASVILIRVDKAGDADAAKKAEEKIRGIHAEAKGNADFAELAKKYSQDSFAGKGGDLGYFTRNKMLPEFSERVFKLNVGELSEVFQTKHGFHILKLTDKKSGEYSPYEAVEDKVRKLLIEERGRQKTKEYVEALRKKADVKIYF